jgi:peptidoglycan/LPS O-acetylase OafA/YrhL
MGKLKVLDGLRGYASLMLFLAHFPQVENSRIAQFIYHVVSYSKMGYLGVDFFFVLSGFLITRIIINEKKLGKFCFKNFYKKRVLRIFPVYYFTLIMIGIFITWEKLFFTITFTYNYSYPFEKVRYPFEHFWSLCVEEHFYILFPMFLYFLKLRNAQNIVQYYIPIFCIIAAFMTYVFFEKNIADKMVFSSSYCRILSLSFGSVFAFKETEIDKLNFTFKQFLIISAVAILIYTLGVKSDDLSSIFFPPIIRLISFSILSSIIFIWVLKLEKKPSNLKCIFSNSVVTFIGGISYGLYLYHFPIIFIIGQKYENYIGIVKINDAIIIIVASFVMSIISYFFIEKPILKLKKII